MQEKPFDLTKDIFVHKEGKQHLSELRERTVEEIRVPGENLFF